MEEAQEQGSATDTPLARPAPLTFVTTSLFLRECYDLLMRSPLESLHYVAGVRIGAFLSLDRLVSFRLEVQQVAYVLGDIIASTAALMLLSERGIPLTGWSHCHPGEGIERTSPSPTDLRHQQRLEAGGYACIGLIMARDGAFRFFSVELPFTSVVIGRDVTRLGPDVYHLDLDFSAKRRQENDDHRIAARTAG